MGFRNAVILSFCIAAGLEVFSGCAYNDKYVEIVLVDSGRQPESVPSQSQNHIPADTGNEANSVYAPEEAKEKRKAYSAARRYPHASAHSYADAYYYASANALAHAETHACRNVDASTYKHAGAHAGRTGRKVQRRAGCRKRRAR